MYTPVIIISLIVTIQSATIKKNSTLDVLRSDIAQVGNALEDFTFEIIQKIIDYDDASTEDISTTNSTELRKKRSLEEEVAKICTKKCDDLGGNSGEQIRMLKMEIQKLQNTIFLLQDQQKMVRVLNSSHNLEELSLDSRGELIRMRNDLSGMIASLEDTQKLIDHQQKKDIAMEMELTKQRDEIWRLKKIVAEFINPNNDTEENPRLRSANSELKKLLKSLPEEEEEEDEEVTKKIKDLQKQVSKKRRDDALMKELKQLEKSIVDKEKEKEKETDSSMLQKLIKALSNNKPEPQSRGLSDLLKPKEPEINNLQDLQEAINKLRPKQETDSTQFESALSQLINGQKSIVQNQSSLPQEKPCVAPPNHYQFFPAPNYYPPPGYNGAPYEKQYPYPAETYEPNGKPGEDLRHQIETLQAAINNLNQPDFTKSAENRAMVDDLQRQVGDLRGFADNVNPQPEMESFRKKRSLNNNEIEESGDIAKEIVKRILTEDQTSELDQVEDRIKSLKSRLDFRTESSNARAASPFQFPSLAPPTQSDYYSYEPTKKELTKSFKKDFLTVIIGKILDKIIDAIPTIVQKLFGFSLAELTRDGQDYDTQTLIKNFGNLSFLPLIHLRLLQGIASFLKLLKKNSFFKNFLLPALILGIVAGSILFLIWWLQCDDKGEMPSGSNNPNQYPSSYGPPMYSKNNYHNNK